MKGLHLIAFWLLVIGGLNWGLSAFGWNVVDKLGSSVSMVVYVLVGLSAIYDIDMLVEYDDRRALSKYIEVLTPYGEESAKLSIPYGFLGLKAPKKIIVKALNEEVEIPVNKQNVVIYQLCFVFSVLITILVIFHLKIFGKGNVLKKILLFKPNKK